MALPASSPVDRTALTTNSNGLLVFARQAFSQLTALRARRQQLTTLGGEIGVPVTSDGRDAVKVAKNALKEASRQGADVVIVDAKETSFDRLGGGFNGETVVGDITDKDVLRAADILRDARVPIETGPHKHNVGQTFFLYCYEPGGNRVEVANAGARLMLAPDWQPVVWTETERKKGQAWGLKTIETFHTHGTPPIDQYAGPRKK